MWTIRRATDDGSSTRSDKHHPLLGSERVASAARRAGQSRVLNLGREAPRVVVAGEWEELRASRVIPMAVKHFGGRSERALRDPARRSRRATPRVD